MMLKTFGVELYRKYIEIRNKKKSFSKFPHFHHADNIRNNTVTLYCNDIYLDRKEERRKKGKGTKIKIPQSFKFKTLLRSFSKKFVSKGLSTQNQPLNIFKPANSQIYYISKTEI